MKKLKTNKSKVNAATSMPACPELLKVLKEQACEIGITVPRNSSVKQLSRMIERELLEFHIYLQAA
jgi:hypothetical protein